LTQKQEEIIYEKNTINSLAVTNDDQFLIFGTSEGLLKI
jgi:hypothetical protein